MFIFSTSFSTSVDCPGLKAFAKQLSINIKQPTIWTQLQSDCCLASGITCNDTPRVITIDWNNLNLNGFFNGSLLPSSIVTLKLYQNSLNGTLPIIWPTTLTHLDVSNNDLMGDIVTTWPSGLKFLYLGSNLLTGLLPTTWPANIITIYFENNFLTTYLPTVWPTTLWGLQLYNNLLTGSISTSSWPPSLRQLFIDNNFLTGNISVLPRDLANLHLGKNQNTKHNKFIGTLKLNQPVSHHINYNQIDDILISDVAQITSCDLSDNPLLGNPHLVSLTICVKNNLYDAVANAIKTHSSYLAKTASSTIAVRIASYTVSSILQTNIMATKSKIATLNTYPSSSYKTLTISKPYLIERINESTNADVIISNDVETILSLKVTLSILQLVIKINEMTWQLYLSTFAKLTIDTLVLITVVYKTPFLREFNKSVRKRFTKMP